jgi:D-xylose transport system permease protein
VTQLDGTLTSHRGENDDGPEKRSVRPIRTPVSTFADIMKRHRLASVTVGIVGVWIVFWAANSAFLGVQNLWNLSVQIVPVGLLALGLVFVLLVGEIDLSSAVLSGVTATIAARLVVSSGEPLAVGIIAAIVVAVAVMAIEAVIVLAGVPSLIVTLGGMIALSGALLVALPSSFEINLAGTSYSNLFNYAFPPAVGWAIGGLAVVGRIAWWVQSEWASIRSGAVRNRTLLLVAKSVGMAVATAVIVRVLNKGGGLPLPIVLFLAMLLAANWFLRSTSYGVHLYAVGGNRDAARRAGIRVRSLILLSFMVLGVCAALSGMIQAAYVSGVSAASGPSSEILEAIAAVVIGGVSLFGGKGSAWGALVGAILIGSIADGVVLLGLPTQVQDFVTAGILVVAVGVDSFSLKRLLQR